MNPEEKIRQLEARLNELEKSSAFFFKKDIQMYDGRNLIFNGATGTRIGTSVTQKLGLWNVTPIIQPTVYATAITDIGTVIAAADNMRTLGRNIGLWK